MAHDRRDHHPFLHEKETEDITRERTESHLDHTANKAGTTVLPDHCF